MQRSACQNHWHHHWGLRAVKNVDHFMARKIHHFRALAKAPEMEFHFLLMARWFSGLERFSPHGKQGCRRLHRLLAGH